MEQDAGANKIQTKTAPRINVNYCVAMSYPFGRIKTFEVLEAGDFAARDSRSTLDKGEVEKYFSNVSSDS
jgi:hypothetical protein